MSTSIDQAFVKNYVADVHDVFQRRGSFLLPAVRHKTEVVGATTTFQKVGQGVATTKARHGTITPMNQSHTPVECTLADFYAGDWVDKLDEAKTNADERRLGARPQGRRPDLHRARRHHADGVVDRDLGGRGAQLAPADGRGARCQRRAE